MDAINPAWILDDTGVLFNNILPFGLVLLVVIAFAILVYLAIRSGQGYSPDDADTHAEEYAGIIREAHGGMTAFLWVSFAAILIWTIVYFVQHWSEFSVLFGG